MKRIRIVFGVLAVLLSLHGCTGGDGPAPTIGTGFTAWNGAPEPTDTIHAGWIVAYYQGGPSMGVAQVLLDDGRQGFGAYYCGAGGYMPIGPAWIDVEGLDGTETSPWQVIDAR